MSIVIKYTGVPLAFCTGSHCSDKEVRLLFVTLGMLGVGILDSSPSCIEAKRFNCSKNLQLDSQLVEFPCKVI